MFVRDGKLGCVQESPRKRFFPRKHIEEFIERNTVCLPKKIDRTDSQSVPFSRRGGDDKKSTGDSLSERKQMKEELRSWR